MGGVKEGNLEYWLCRERSICKGCLEKEKPAFVIKSLLISKEHKKLYRQNPSLRGKLLDSIRIALLIKSQAAIAVGNKTVLLRDRKRRTARAPRLCVAILCRHFCVAIFCVAIFCVAISPPPKKIFFQAKKNSFFKKKNQHFFSKKKIFKFFFGGGGLDPPGPASPPRKYWTLGPAPAPPPCEETHKVKT